ncbi:glycosyltransferase family 2 protein [Saprospiraceae bacterium]|nr:glycosyltransferase family 2 protein [Saprospiraceae bacterium]
MMKLSTVIITYNEEDKIERCIKSAQVVSEEVIILDSFSTDSTVKIAESLGAIVHSQKFKGFIKQREDSIRLATHELILALDADEYLSPELELEILHIKENPEADAYKLNRLSSIAGHWIYNGSWHPDYIVRLFKRDKVTNGGESPHDKIIANKGSNTKRLRGVLYHDAHDTVEERIESVKKHSTVAAETKFKKGIRSNKFKAYLKTGWKFLVEYFFKMGILDGHYGWIAAKTTAQYIYLRENKIIELQKNGSTNE